MSDITASSDGLSDSDSTTVTNMVVAKVNIRDSGIALNQLSGSKGAIIAEVISRKEEVREGMLSGSQMFSERFNAINGDFVAVEIKASELRFSGNISGESSDTIIIDLIVFEINANQRDIGRDSLSDIFSSSTGDVVAAEIEMFEVKFFKDISDMTRGGVIEGSIGERERVSVSS